MRRTDDGLVTRPAEAADCAGLSEIDSVGVTPSEHSSGSSRALGPITKTGNGHVWRLLVEAAWYHRARYRAGTTMRARWDQAPAAARIRGDQDNRRLHTRWVNSSNAANATPSP